MISVINKNVSDNIKRSDGTSIRFAFVCLRLRIAVIDINKCSSKKSHFFADGALNTV